MTNDSDFDALAKMISEVHTHAAVQAGRAVNLSLTLRNWAIGCVIFEYEQNGSDRATYGERLLDRLAIRLQKSGLRTVSGRDLRRYRQFYIVYPEIWQSLTAKFPNMLPEKTLQHIHAHLVVTAAPKGVPVETLVSQLSFTHIAELILLDDPLKRAFYESQSIRGNWSVRELKRQIGSLFYERTALSTDKKKLTEFVQSEAEHVLPLLEIRDPYVFEFLGLEPREVMYESQLENALLEKIQDFLLELGHGFCFEARQKRILIGDSYGFVDLVFYHRILKCHVLLDLKLEGFTHENIGQLNTYVSWYRKNMMVEGDNPPIGMLLCTEKDHALVEYALAGMDNQLFVSKYMLALPDREEMRRFLEESLRESRGA